MPRLLDVYDDGEWVALVYEEVGGRHPAVPWKSDEVERVAGAVDDLGAALRPSPWPDAPGFATGRINDPAAAAPQSTPRSQPWMKSRAS